MVHVYKPDHVKNDVLTLVSMIPHPTHEDSSANEIKKNFHWLKLQYHWLKFTFPTKFFYIVVTPIRPYHCSGCSIKVVSVLRQYLGAKCNAVFG